ncbi:alpha/beta hydrolase [Methylobacterium sp. J-030]|uniref:alpha/beta fold hydrolase n=1 Tax=Methylobacterium sp. J-030 TaxID=2836627 RepID=UPI001FB9EF3E|nr:alpha/beta hydrolase [Methylobacterium sp. J-030]MCJ2068660.1 alpha/beta hydrolase [Methylobacterium sp. J-030]
MTLVSSDQAAKPGEHRDHRIRTSLGEVYAREYAGRGPAFVMMHGFPDNLHIYDDLVPHLTASGRRVVIFDFLGFGQSDKPAGAQYSFRQQLGDLEAVVDQLGLGQIVPVAHDSSGAAALNFAIDHPDRTAGLVVLNAAFAASSVARWPELITLFATPGLAALSGALIQSPEQFGWVINFQREAFKQHLADKHKAHYDTFLGPVIDKNFREDGAGPAFAQMTAQFFGELERNATRIPELGKLDIPVKVIWGQNDPYLNADHAREYASYLKRSSLHLLPAGHWLQLDEPALVAAEMLS